MMLFTSHRKSRKLSWCSCWNAFECYIRVFCKFDLYSEPLPMVHNVSILYFIFSLLGLRQVLRLQNTLSWFTTTTIVYLMVQPFTSLWIPRYKMAEWTSTVILGMWIHILQVYQDNFVFAKHVKLFLHSIQLLDAILSSLIDILPHILNFTNLFYSSTFITTFHQCSTAVSTHCMYLTAKGPPICFFWWKGPFCDEI